MSYYDESKSERVNRRTAIFLTATIYFLIFSGFVFSNHPEFLPEVVKEWINIEKSENQENIKKELPLTKDNKDKA